MPAELDHALPGVDGRPFRRCSMLAATLMALDADAGGLLVAAPPPGGLRADITGCGRDAPAADDELDRAPNASPRLSRTSGPRPRPIRPCAPAS